MRESNPNHTGHFYFMEQWKDIDGYEGIYQVSDLGRVKSFKNGKEKILKSSAYINKYCTVSLRKNGTTKSYIVHRLVWKAFKGETDLCIDHIIEGNKLDNRLSNLQTLTIRENTAKYNLSLKKTSKYTGVCWYKNYNKWLACIKINGKKKHLGFFINEIDAAEAYQKAVNNLR